MNKILIYGYGNPGRRDDGLGIAFAEQMGNWAKKSMSYPITIETNYQLNIEDAELISHYDTVIFADASQETMDSFALTPIEPAQNTVEFTMHAVAPGYVVHLCQNLFQKTPHAFLLHIKGYEWEMAESLSKAARNNLNLALEHMQNMLVNQELPEFAANNSICNNSIQ